MRHGAYRILLDPRRHLLGRNRGEDGHGLAVSIQLAAFSLNRDYSLCLVYESS
jgi:hypothetical protein